MGIVRELVVSFPIFILVAYLGSHLVVVPTGSMTPTINEGDVVLVDNIEALGFIKEFNAADVKNGDIIIYKSSNPVENTDSIIHRVVAINESDGRKYFTLKGDANRAADDEKVYPDNITGKVITWGGNPIKMPLGWLINRFNT